jgi:CxxC motif-containing protein (DUF1111 family)
MSCRKKLIFFFSICIYAGAFVFIGCETKDDSLEGQYEQGEELSGGATTVFDESANAFGNAAPNLTGDGDLKFVTGNSFFKTNWVVAPASTEGIDGLGPFFNSRSCSGCHVLDGRGRPPLDANESEHSLLVRLSIPGRNEYGGVVWEPNYGDQLNINAIPGIKPEGKVNINYQEIPGHYSDGTTYSLRKPTYTFTDLSYGDLAAGALFSPRVAQQLIGLGLLEAVDENTILAFADENDQNKDGISGRPNYVYDFINKKTVIGRFGWKANQPSLQQQISAAFLGDMGLTTTLFPNQNCTSAEQDCKSSIDGGMPEVDDSKIEKIAFYDATLAVPARRSVRDPQVLAGKKQFLQAKCDNCHKTKIITANHPTIPELSNQIIRPYTDLLLHDMGEGLADGRPDFEATGQEWRTPPLWGIGLIKTVNKHTFLLHDGRARNIEEAILWHGGEAETSKQAFLKMPANNRETLIKFLESL